MTQILELYLAADQLLVMIHGPEELQTSDEALFGRNQREISLIMGPELDPTSV